MRKKIILFSVAFVLVYCHTKKKATETTTEKMVVSAKTPIQIAQKRWPNTTSEELVEGKTIFEGKCTKCHNAKRIETRSEKNWLHEIDDMSPKAHLTPEEKDKLTKYILSYREAHTSTD